jgi:hypothetical protein
LRGLSLHQQILEKAQHLVRGIFFLGYIRCWLRQRSEPVQNKILPGENIIASFGA